MRAPLRRPCTPRGMTCVPRLSRSYGLDDLTFIDWNVTVWLGMVREPVVDLSSGDRMYLSSGEILEIKSKDLNFESLRNLRSSARTCQSKQGNARC